MSFWEYVRRAFHARYPVPGLGPISLNKWALAGAGILGLGFPPLLLLTLGLEVCYLYGLATNRRFRNLVDGERLSASRGEWVRRVDTLRGGLDRASRDRLEALMARCREVEAMAAVTGTAVPTIEEAKRSGMDQLVYMYLRLLASRATLQANFSEDERAKIRSEADALQKDLAGGKVPDAVRRSKEGTLEIQKRRLENLDRAAEQRAVIESELERIEKQVELIREDTAMGREPVALSSRIDQVVTTLGDTSEWMRKNADLLGDVGEDKPRDVPVFLSPRGSAKEGG